jgi:hypothetical protein
MVGEDNLHVQGDVYSGRGKKVQGGSQLSSMALPPIGDSGRGPVSVRTYFLVP